MFLAASRNYSCCHVWPSFFTVGYTCFSPEYSIHNVSYDWLLGSLIVCIIINRGRNGYETRQSSLLYVSILVFGLDRAPNVLLLTEELVDRNVLIT